ncbi:Protein kinase domain-containing protein [Heracleum sosnowskyi]|uniref:Protein kinase domain-containing protein n=1 Tax=Heracleum sosnowskyi TaxID=360622 RepID=A0AAD8IIU7_9APIA|nr:Protein kinase domain-containing protein [Heracleum sosnowskyi]
MEIKEEVDVTDDIREFPRTEKSEIKQEGSGLKVKVANEIEQVPTTEMVEIQEDGSLKLSASSTATPKNVPGKCPRHLGSKDMIFRADQIDLKSLDIQLEKHLSRTWSKNVDPTKPKEVWEIDLAKLQIKHLVARGTYGTIYRGTYDNLDVAVKVLDWGEDGMATTAETASLRASFRQEVAVWHQLDHPNVTRYPPVYILLAFC